MTARPPIPVTVLGGFLGAGKTTLLNALLARGDRRYGIMVNDFGAINIDATLIRRRDTRMITLTNGCMCCGPAADQNAALLALAEGGDDGIPPDQIVIETSGVADPRRVAQLAALEPGLLIDAVVVLADASTAEGLLGDRLVGDTLIRQFARADLILLTKTDLVNPAGLARAQAAIARAAPGVAMIASPASTASPDDGGFSAALVASGRLAPPAGTAAARHLPDDDIDHQADAHFSSWSWASRGPVDRGRLLATLTALPPGVLRVKGVLPVAGADGRPAATVVQMVGRRWRLTPLVPAVCDTAPALGDTARGIGHDGQGALVLIAATGALPAAPDLQTMFDAIRL
ncbi:cobalamin biosynthesis protein CobW [Tistrella bauzanensis]|uniref:Cobalamin biosynthesis protein CobW n=1 Tax=Tistrella bauzanensis TaxID=657419 RepID=A0ABQ1IL92_9PROT|nr:GTP-binding protein [Tistrella bauzanensis]GGB44605.1 cobalamin biosynthesis protein CobW [Tistrella bauzanensis]